MFLFLFFFISKSEEILPSGIKLSEISNFINTYVETYIGKTLTSANIYLIKDKNIIFEKSYGFYDLENKIYANNESIYEWGSITKTIASVCLFQLIEEEKINLDDNIEKYLGNSFLKYKKFKEEIKIKNLLHHNAGFEDIFAGFQLYGKSHNIPLNTVLYRSQPKQFSRPNEYVGYSNYGFGLVGLIIEKVSNKSL